MERALLVVIKLRSDKDGWPLDDIAQEMRELAKSACAQVIGEIHCSLERPTANLFIGKGKADEVALAACAENIDTVIFSHDVSATHQRNLEEAIGKKTIDRTQLILDIFAQHAKSPEGKTQVELAQLQYLLPRLVGKGVILSRLGGGIGTRGPGEQKLEVDRRQIRKRIDKLRQELKSLTLHRQRLRSQRQEKQIPLISLVGYTNAGKSTLLNTLTKTSQLVQDSLFTTLDPLAKSLSLSNGEQVIISDTVGFLNNLPHHLIEAFKATLEEVGKSHLLIHVLDAAHPRVYQQAKAVQEVLKYIQADSIPVITALNKIDLLEDRAWLARISSDFPNTLGISAKYGQNVDKLHQKIEEVFRSRMVKFNTLIAHSRMDLVDLFYRQGKVNKIEYTDKGIEINANLPKTLFDKLLHDKELGESIRISK